jgi:hypothetical protein
VFTLVPGQGPVFRSVGTAPFPPLDFDIILQSEDYIKTPEETNPGSTLVDATYTITTGDITVNKYSISIIQTFGEQNDLLEVDFQATGSGKMLNGFFDFKSSGYGTLRVIHPLLTKEISAPFYRKINSPIWNLTGYVSGSLGKSMSDSLWPLTTGKNATHLPVYTSQNPNYVRNTNCWVSSLDWTGVSPWNSSFLNLRAGTAISPRHIIFAWHYQIPVGAEIHFITSDNQIVSRTITATQSAPFNYVSDTTIGLLNADLPESIKFYKVFPSNLSDYFGSLSTFPDIPVVGFDQQEKALMKSLTKFTLNPSFPEQEFQHPIVQNSSRYPLLTETIVGGDSGNPVFGVVNNEPILLSLWTTPTSGPPFHKMHDSINSIMTSLGGGYQLQVLNLSGFTNYS